LRGSGSHNNSSDLTHPNTGFLGCLQITYHRKGNKRVAKRLWAYTSRPKNIIRTLVVTFDAAKHYVVPTETLFKIFNFSVHKAA